MKIKHLTFIQWMKFVYYRQHQSYLYSDAEERMKISLKDLNRMSTEYKFNGKFCQVFYCEFGWWCVAKRGMRWMHTETVEYEIRRRRRQKKRNWWSQLHTVQASSRHMSASWNESLDYFMRAANKKHSPTTITRTLHTTHFPITLGLNEAVSRTRTDWASFLPCNKQGNF